MYRIEQNNRRAVFVGDYGKLYSRCFSKNKFYEQYFLDYIRKLQLDGEYIDVGGNVGNHALYFSIFCDSDVVHTFEPLEKYQEYIRENILANKIANKVILHSCGLSESSSPIKFVMGGREKNITNLISLDNYDINLTKLTLVKIDVEGNEDKVINGAIKTIEKHKPRLFIEVMEHSKLMALDRKLKSIGYRRIKNVFNASPTYEWVAG